MGVLFTIIAILFASLFLIIPLVEKFGPEPSPEKLQKITRWSTPLMIILILAMAARYLMA